MAKKSSGGISISSIIFMVVMYNVFFGGDDEDKNQVEIVDQGKPSIEQTIKDVKDQLVESTEVIIKEASDALADKKEDEAEKPEPAPKPREKEKEMIAKPEVEELKPLNEKKDMGMKKL